MRWFTKLFRQKKSAEEVREWLREEQKKQEQEYNDALNQLQHDFPELITIIKKALVVLERAELKNPNVPERAKHYMIGNREQFLKITHRFIENLFVPQEATDISQIDVLFHQYANNTARSAAILSEFFGEEVKELRKCTAEVEAKMQQMKVFHAKKDHLDHIHQLLRQLDEIKKEREHIEKQQTGFEGKLQQLKNKQNTLRKEKEEFTNKPEYVKTKNDLVDAARERQEAEQEITGLFLPLSDPIKKYAHKHKNEKLATYGENALQALIHDYSLGILKHVTALWEAIEKGELGLKPEKVQKALESIKKLNKENLGNMIHRYANAKKRETDTHHDVAQRPIMQEYEQYAVELKEVKDDIEQLEKTIARLTLPTDEKIREQLKQELEHDRVVLV